MSSFKKDKFLSLILCVISSLFLSLSFPKFDFWFLAWGGLLPLFFALKGKRPFISFLFSYLTGLIFFLIIICWLIHVTLLGYLLLAAYLALYFSAFGFFISIFSQKPAVLKLLILPSVWVILEFIRSHLFTGFGWALLGYSQYQILPVIQISDITGAYGVSFIIVMVNIALFTILQGSRKRENSLCFLITIFVLIVSLGYGFLKLTHKSKSQILKVSVIQGNIPQEIKWDKEACQDILDKYIELTKIASQDKPDILIWPETAFPGFLEENPLLLEKLLILTQELKVNLLFGAISANDSLIYNSAVLISSQGKIRGNYHKLHLVPFGEYVPFREVFSFLPQLAVLGDFTSGKEYTLFSLRNDKAVKFSALICFEDTVPELSGQFVKKGARLLVNITNDAWFKDTSAPYQHLQASVFRAVENHTPLVRCANTGISAFIDKNGRIMAKVSNSQNKETFISGYKTQEMELRNTTSFYAKFGDIFVLGCAIIFIFGFLKFRRRNV